MLTRSMPRVRRLPPVRLSAPPDAVRAAAVSTLGGTVLDAHTVRIPVADEALTEVAVDLVIEADGAGSVVHGEPRGTLEIPFFQWAFRPLVRVSQRRTTRTRMRACNPRSTEPRRRRRPRP